MHFCRSITDTHFGQGRRIKGTRVSKYLPPHTNGSIVQRNSQFQCMQMDLERRHFLGGDAGCLSRRRRIKGRCAHCITSYHCSQASALAFTLFEGIAYSCSVTTGMLTQGEKPYPLSALSPQQRFVWTAGWKLQDPPRGSEAPLAKAQVCKGCQPAKPQWAVLPISPIALDWAVLALLAQQCYSLQPSGCLGRGQGLKPLQTQE